MESCFCLLIKKLGSADLSCFLLVDPETISSAPIAHPSMPH